MSIRDAHLWHLYPICIFHIQVSINQSLMFSASKKKKKVKPDYPGFIVYLCFKHFYMKNIYLFLFDGYSDWEISYCTPEIYKNERVSLKTFSIDGNNVRSMGGLQVVPELSLNDILPEKIDMLILPGGTAWDENKLNDIQLLVIDLVEQRKCIAAICAATFFLAKNGILDTIKHTSNDLGYLKSVVPNYKGEALYQSDKAFTDNNIITASGIAPIEFAKEIFSYIELFDKATLENWYQLYKNGIWAG